VSAASSARATSRTSSPIRRRTSRRCAALSCGRRPFSNCGCRRTTSEETIMSATNGRRGREAYGHRLRRMREHGMKPPLSSRGAGGKAPRRNATIDCGWGRLIFGQTFENTDELVAALAAEAPERRDIAFYVRDPHVVLSCAPQELFLDPSHTYRLDLATFHAS